MACLVVLFLFFFFTQALDVTANYEGSQENYF